MPRPYSEDLRLCVVNALDSGKTTREVSALFHLFDELSEGFDALAEQLQRELGAGTRQTQSPSGVADSVGAVLSGHARAFGENMDSGLQ